MKTKDLILKFGYNKLQELCKEKGWRIPHSSEVPDTVYDLVWVNDSVEKEEDKETHAMALFTKSGNTVLLNKSFKEHVCIIKDI